MLDGKKHGAFIGLELRAHLIDLFYAYPVLPGDGPPQGDRTLEDFAAKSLRLMALFFAATIIKYQGVQIAIPGMKNIQAAQAVFFLHFRNSHEHFPQTFAWMVPSIHK